VLAKQNDRMFGNILSHTKGIAFFATPHRGGRGTTLGEVASKSVNFLSGSSRNDIIKCLKENSPYLAQLAADFAHQYEDYQFLSIVESRNLYNVPGVRTVRLFDFPDIFNSNTSTSRLQIVVDQSSAVLGLAGHREHVAELDRDHRQICKFSGGTQPDPDYIRISRRLKTLAVQALDSTRRERAAAEAGRQPAQQSVVRCNDTVRLNTPLQLVLPVN
jgi:hypothetical protein